MFHRSPIWRLAAHRSRRQVRQGLRAPTPPSPRTRAPTPTFYLRTDLDRMRDDFTREACRGQPAGVVEAVVQARSEIWGGQNGRDKRQRNEDEQSAKRQRLEAGQAELPIYATKFSDEVLAAEERRPKKKVAVMIGYAGTGYKGMQLTHDQKTIEGDLFQAFVAAGAISKANADDPKKSSFVRCARTDKGVHAAGNVISLKLIVEDADIVEQINRHLTPQIRVWGFERTNNSFSSYQAVDSRIYEYLIPTHSFLPPHPTSFLGRHCDEWAEKRGDTAAYRQRQEEVRDFWARVDDETIKPILAEYDPALRSILEKALWLKGPAEATKAEGPATDDKSVEVQPTQQEESAEVQAADYNNIEVQITDVTGTETPLGDDQTNETLPDGQADPPPSSRSTVLNEATRRLRQAYVAAKRSYRIPRARVARIQAALDYYVGTRNYHNFTVEKTYKDPSSKRVIKSFAVNPEPILIDGTEWLSLKVHGQSFMMHQIRKMVGMVALVVRCGCEPHRMYESLGPTRISIPKAPSLGLLLERPVFDSYNKRAQKELGREPIDFDKYKAEIDRFKQEQIYERVYRDEEKENVFGNFFNHIDSFPSPAFLFVTSGGFDAIHDRNLPTGDQQAHADGTALADADADADALMDGDASDGEVVKDSHGDEG